MKCLIVVVHGLRLDCVGCYGNDWVGTPNLDRLATESVVFDQHIADCPDREAGFLAWSPGGQSVVGQLSAVKAELVGDAGLPPPSSFTISFQKTRLVQNGRNSSARLNFVFDAARKAAGSLVRHDQAILWIDLPGVLPPWEVPEEFLELYFPRNSQPAEDGKDGVSGALAPWTGPLPPTVSTDDEATLLRVRRTYAAAVSHFDAQLGLLLDSLEAKEGGQDWLLMLTAPYGLPLGDHGVAGSHRPWLHEELVHLPLLVRLPSAAEAGRRVFCLTQTSDLPATMLDAFGLPVTSIHGRSLLPLCRGDVDSIRAEAYSMMRTANAEEWALRTSEWAFLLPVEVPSEYPPRGPQLYVKPEDRFEVNNVVQHHAELAEEMERKLRERMKG